MKSIIVLQTDFSLEWPAVAEMKGVIKQVDRELEIEDSCHVIKSFDPWEASLNLHMVEPYWPAGTVFVSVVDPGVGTSRRASVAKLKDGNYVVTPDNGTLTHLKHTVGIVGIRKIDESINRYRPQEAVSVFHGRDLFAYCAARLAAGIITFEEVGPEYPVEEVVECPEYHLRPVLKPFYAEGFIMTGLKHFGGVQFNITNREWKDCGFVEGDRVMVTIEHHGEVAFAQTVLFAGSFGFVAKGDPVLYCGSSMFLSLDCNQERFMQKYNIGTGKEWKVLLEKKI